MAPPGAGDDIVAVAAAAAPAAERPPPPPPAPRAPALHDRDAKPGRPGPRPAPASAGARIVSLGVQAAVMAAALALFLLFAAAAAVLLLHLVVAARAFRHHRSRYRVPTLDPPSAAAPPLLRAGLTPADLARLPSFAFPASPRGGPSSSSSCAVCLEHAGAGERWRALPACGHAFHAACVDRWLARSPACPVCRAAVAVPVS